MHNFGAGSDAQTPAGGLALGEQEVLYGATTGGDVGCKGNGSGGTLFELKPSGRQWKESILYCFAGQYIDGFPDSGVIVDANGNLFGTVAGGVGGLGNVYELTRESRNWKFDTIYSDGGCCLVLDQAGNLYGGLGGGIGELSPGSDGWTYKDLSDKTSSLAPLIMDAHGNLYGTDPYGGNKRCSGGCGTAFQLTPKSDGTWTYHVAHSFGSFQNDGILPVAGLVMDTSGNAYGATLAGGTYNCGNIYELKPSGGHWTETVVHEFHGPEGCAPLYTLALDGNGNLYGMAQGGDNTCGPCGLIFKLAPQGGGKWKYSVLHTFHGPEGADPYGVIVDGKGNIFGTTMNGGKYNLGVAFEITP